MAVEEYVMRLGTISVLLLLSVLALAILIDVKNRLEFRDLQIDGISLSLILSRNSSLSYSFKYPTTIMIKEGVLFLHRGSYSVIFPYYGDINYEAENVTSICLINGVDCDGS